MRSHALLALFLPLALSCNGDKATDSGPVDSGATDSGADTARRITILHTNDWQSHMLGTGPNAEYTPGSTGDDGTWGGLARAKTLVDEIRGATAHPVVLYDGGDWMAGDLFQLLGTTHAAELQLMEHLGYDAAVIGNHEYDWETTGLAAIIDAGDANGVTVPLLASNVEFSADDAEDDALEAHFTSGRVQTTRVDTLDNGLTIGLFGLLGEDAALITPGISPAAFTDPTEAAVAAVDELQAQGVDIIVALTHAGVRDNVDESPDHLLAQAVDGIDVIVGGHSHTPLPDTETANGTVILQAGAYTRYVGQLDLVLDEDSGDWAVESYQLHELTDDIIGDADTIDMIDGFVAELEAGPLLDLGYGFDQAIAHTANDVVVDNCQESGLGNFITDSYLSHLNSLDPDDPFVAAIQVQGVIRDDILTGSTGVQAFSDLFRVLPLGLGNDDVPGYALTSFYLTSADVGDVCELAASIAPTYGCTYMADVSGIRCTVDMSKSTFNRTTKVELYDAESGDWTELGLSDRDTLHHVTVDSYAAGLMGILSGLTYGAIAPTPKDANGDVIEDNDALLFDADPNTDGVQEVKLWQALVETAAAQEDTDGDGLPDIPASYAAAEGRYSGLE